MNVIERIWGEHYVTYPQFELAIEPGLTVIRGANRAGKTLAPAALGSLFYHAPPTLDRKNSAKVVHGRNSLLGVSWRNQSGHWELQQSGKGQSVRNRLLHNGEDLKFRKGSDLKDELGRAWPLGPEIFYTASYLNSFNRHILQQGTGAERLNWFDSVFDLSSYDAIYDELNEQSKKLKARMIERRAIESQHSEIADQAVDLKRLKSVHRRLKAAYDTVFSRLEQLNKRIEKMSRAAALQEQIQTGWSAERLAKMERKLSVDYEAARKALREAVQHNEQAAVIKSAAEKRRTLRRELKALPKGNYEKAVRQAQKYKALYLEARDQAEKLEQLAQLKSRLKTLLDSDDRESIKRTLKLFSRADKISELRDVCQRQLGVAEDETERFELLLKEEGDKTVCCPTCGNQMRRRVIEDLLKASRERETKSRADIKTCNAALKVLELRAEIKSFGEVQIADLEDLKQQTLHYAELARQLRQREGLEIQLKDLPETEAVELLDVSKIERRVDRLKNELFQVRNDQEILAKLDGEQADPKMLAKLRTEVEELSAQLREANNSLQQTAADMSAGTVTNRRIEELEARLSDLKEGTEHAHLYEHLLVAYGPRGLRLLQIETLAESFVANLNSYSGLILGEPFEFQYHIGTSKFDLIAVRNERPSDVVLLSGSESRQFRLLSLISLLPLLPAHLRTNLAVLDELEAGMSPESKKLFASEFIPRLQSAIPSIIVVTPQPQSELFLRADRDYTVTKESGVSRLELAA